MKPQALFLREVLFPCLPLVVSLLGIPVFIHESDLSMGLANKIAYKLKPMYTTFEQDPGLTKVKHVGAVTKVDKDHQC